MIEETKKDSNKTESKKHSKFPLSKKYIEKLTLPKRDSIKGVVFSWNKNNK